MLFFLSCESINKPIAEPIPISIGDLTEIGRMINALIFLPDLLASAVDTVVCIPEDTAADFKILF